MVNSYTWHDNKKFKIRFSYRLAQIFLTAVFKFFFGLKVTGRTNIPVVGPIILASNHQSWFDPLMIGSSCPREIHYAAKRELFDNIILGPFVRHFNSIPVKRSGFDRKALVKLKEVLEGGGGMIIFPEGTRFKDGNLHTPKLGVGMLALHSQAQIVPCYISGSARLERQILGRGLKIRFGKPFICDDLKLDGLNNKDSYQAIANEVMHKIAELGGIKTSEIACS